jgi:hypothetical protein
MKGPMLDMHSLGNMSKVLNQTAVYIESAHDI